MIHAQYTKFVFSTQVADPLYDCEITNSSCNGECPPGHYCEDGIKNPCPAGLFIF